MSKNLKALTLVQIMQRFPDAEAARVYLEKRRWPEGPVCPHCGHGEAYTLVPRESSKRPCRKGLYKCKSCRKQFTVTVKTIFEDSHIPLNKWLIAIYLMCASKKGVSAHQLHRMLNLSYKGAWFMCHRIRYAMQQHPMADKLGGIVEVDEAYVGRKYPHEPRQGRPNASSRQRPVVTLVERGGRVRSFHVGRVDHENVGRIMQDNIEAQARLMTDELNLYTKIGKQFASHETVEHSKGEYMRGDVGTNTVEGFFALLKRGLHGTYHAVGAHHLHRYLAEFDFRYNARKTDDGTRTELAIAGIEGKRLKYKD